MAWSLCITALSMIGKPARCFSRLFVLVLAVGLSAGARRLRGRRRGERDGGYRARDRDARRGARGRDRDRARRPRPKPRRKRPRRPRPRPASPRLPSTSGRRRAGTKSPLARSHCSRGAAGASAARDPRAGVHLGSGGAALRRRPRLRARVRGRGAGGAGGWSRCRGRSTACARERRSSAARSAPATGCASRPLQSPALSSPRRGRKPWIHAPPIRLLSWLASQSFARLSGPGAAGAWVEPTPRRETAVSDTVTQRTDRATSRPRATPPCSSPRIAARSTS